MPTTTVLLEPLALVSRPSVETPLMLRGPRPGRLARLGICCLMAAGLVAGDSAVAQTVAGSKTTGSSAAAGRARQATAARVRTNSAARGAALAETPRYRTDERGDLVPDARAVAAIIYSPATGRVVWEQNAFGRHSIASITKVMTALCFLEASPGLAREVTVLSVDTRRASTTYLRSGQRVSLFTIVHLLLIGSDNAAARVLARVSPGGRNAFVKRMNEKAAEFGLTSTTYADPAGLSAKNVSSAFDMARLITAAASDTFISGIMQTPQFTYRVNGRARTVQNTNRLVRSADIDVVGGKTGYISKAGYCLATLLRLPDRPETVAIVVLGARSNTARFWEIRHLFSWLTTRAAELLTLFDLIPAGRDAGAELIKTGKQAEQTGVTITDASRLG